MNWKTALLCFTLLAALWSGIGCEASSGGGDEADSSPVVDVGGDRTGIPDSADDVVEDVEKYPGPEGAVPIFEEQRQGFFDQPFPCDSRVKAGGAPDLSDFPNPHEVELLSLYIKEAELRIKGFSPNGAIYFRFDGPLAEHLFPQVAYTLQDDSSVMLVNITAESQFYGEKIPVETWFWDKEAPIEGYYLEGNVLAVRPLGGYPMRRGELYACIIKRSLRDKEQRYLSRSELVASALGPEASGLYAKILAPLGEWLDQADGIDRDDVAVATVFTVSDPVDEMARAAEYLRNNFKMQSTSPVKNTKLGSTYMQFEGTYEAPNFQTGEPPYDTKGEIVFNKDGEPTMQWMEELDFVLTIPKDTAMPQGGWPVVLYAHGTGGSRYTFTKSIAKYLGEAGLAAISIDQPLQGYRWAVGTTANIEFYSFNFTNPQASRSLFRQAALDDVALTMLVKELEFQHKGKVVKFDPESIGFFGHSQGGLTGPLYLAVEDDVSAAVLSGAGGGLAYTILLRKQLDSGLDMDIKDAVENALKLEFEDELTLFHPVMTLMQLLVDVTDPLNFSPLYFHPRLRAEPLNVFITSGIEDPYTPAVTTENLALAAGIPPLLPIKHHHKGFDILGQTVTTPVNNNMTQPDGTVATAALAQYADAGHFVAFDNSDCRALWLTFLSSALNDHSAVIDK